ncbi:site-specific integrase [Actinocrinis puniceicyclus]|uniref:Site-specific integrase n=1 Tax=Actinocrinis puniceicyclus TaxID=977794 RepID=A0A8J7WMD1_9ACTN|nr:site-specific integrase [Actinocrinis puniceicyclus]MBS2962089.1 site-specific integrase [Actinocrinis puniceicyclus]
MAGKRRFGRIRQLPSGRYQVRYLGPDGVDRPTPETFRTKTEAEKWLVDKEAEINRDDWINPDAGAVSLEQFAEEWLRDHPKMRASTRARSVGLLRLHIVPYLGGKPIGEIKPADIRRWYKQINDGGLGSASVARAYSLLRAIFNTARKDEVIRRNPCQIDGAALYKWKERPVLTISEIYTLIDRMPDRYKALVLLGTFTGLRWGELVGLRRRNIDVVACTVTVESIVVEVDNGRILLDQKPKSDAGLRTVAFPSQIGPALAGHLAAFVDAAPDSYVFTSPLGGVLRRANFRRLWLDALKDAGVPQIRFHDLRHTGATIAAQTGATLKELMQRIGHSTLNAALGYQHASQGRDHVIAAALDKMISKERARQAKANKAKKKPPESGSSA